MTLGRLTNFCDSVSNYFCPRHYYSIIIAIPAEGATMCQKECLRTEALAVSLKSDQASPQLCNLFLSCPPTAEEENVYPMVGRPSGCFSVWGNHGKLWSIPKWRTDLSLLGAQWSAVKSVWERLSSTWKQYWQLSYLTSNPKQEGHQEERTLWRRHSPKTQRNEVRNGNLSLLYPVPGLFHSLHSI